MRDLERLVKPLKWECVGWSGGSGVEGEDDDAWEARTGQSSISYRIDWFGADRFGLETPDETGNRTYYPTLDEAQAAAQADHVARILAALDQDALRAVLAQAVADRDAVIARLRTAIAALEVAK
jgi:hypothetical protein